MNEKVVLRVFSMPCCSHQLCWVNPRFPTYCPECGTRIYLKLKTEAHTIFRGEIWLRTEPKTNG